MPEQEKQGIKIRCPDCGRTHTCWKTSEATAVPAAAPAVSDTPAASADALPPKKDRVHIPELPPGSKVMVVDGPAKGRGPYTVLAYALSPRDGSWRAHLEDPVFDHWEDVEDIVVYKG